MTDGPLAGTADRQRELLVAERYPVGNLDPPR